MRASFNKNTRKGSPLSMFWEKMRGRITVTRIAFSLLGVTMLLALSQGFAEAQLTLKKVVIETDIAPDGFAYVNFENPAVSDATGQRVSFFAVAQNPAKTSIKSRCIRKLDDTGAGLNLACFKGASPDGATFKSFGANSMNDGDGTNGEVAWPSPVSGGKDGVYRGDPTLVAFFDDDDPVAGRLREFSDVALLPNGDVTFKARIIDVPALEDRAVYRCLNDGNGNCSGDNGGTSTLEKLVQENDAVPGGRFLCTLFDVRSSSYGIAFKALTKVDCADDLEVGKNGVYRMAFGGSVEQVALQGDASEPAGSTYNDFLGAPAIEDDGLVAFRARVTGLNSGPNLYMCDPACSIRVGKGDPDADGNQMVDFMQPALDDDGDLAFTAQIRLPNNKKVAAVYICRAADDCRSGNLERIALRDEPAPEVLGGKFHSFGPPSTSPQGKVAFQAKVTRSAKPKEIDGIFLYE